MCVFTKQTLVVRSLATFSPTSSLVHYGTEQTTGEAGVPKMFLEALGKYGDCNGGASSSNGGSLRIERTVATDGSSAKEVICIDDE